FGWLCISQFVIVIVEWILSLLIFFFIFVFACSIVFLFDGLHTGVYLGGLIQQVHLNLMFFPLIVFIMAAFIAFSTGTSWGSFGILLPIAGQIAAATDIELLLPLVAAVLAGGVFGDHCSPISDTTI